MKNIVIALCIFAGLFCSCADGENDYMGMITTGNVSETINTVLTQSGSFTNIFDDNRNTYYERHGYFDFLYSGRKLQYKYIITPPHSLL